MVNHFRSASVANIPDLKRPSRGVGNTKSNNPEKSGCSSNVLDLPESSRQRLLKRMSDPNLAAEKACKSSCAKRRAKQAQKEIGDYHNAVLDFEASHSLRPGGMKRPSSSADFDHEGTEGDVTVQVTCNMNSIKGIVKYRTYSNTARPSIKPLPECDRRKFNTIHLSIPGVQEVYGQENQEWSRDDAVARDLLHPSRRRAGLLEGVHAVHDAITTSRGCCSSSSGVLKSAQQVYRLFKKHGKTYKYVLLDDGLFAVDAKAALPADLLSHHAILADGQEAVRCAGELFVETSNSKDELVMNNKCGIYRPGLFSLQLFETLLEHHFKDIKLRHVNIDEELVFDKDITVSPPKESSIYACPLPLTTELKRVPSQEDTTVSQEGTECPGSSIASRGVDSAPSMTGSPESNSSSSVAKVDQSKTLLDDVVVEMPQPSPDLSTSPDDENPGPLTSGNANQFQEAMSVDSGVVKFKRKGPSKSKTKKKGPSATSSQQPGPEVIEEESLEKE